MKKPEKIESECIPSEPIDPRVKRTRKLLQDSLRSLLHEKRLAEISVQDIAERATVNRATFYAHYQDKQDLAIGVLKADLHTALIRRHPEPPAFTYENLVEMAVVVFEFLGGIQDVCPETAKELQTVGITLQEELCEILEIWLARSPVYKRMFPGSSKETVATVLSWSIFGGAYQWTHSRNRIPAVQACREIVSVLLVQDNRG